MKIEATFKNIWIVGFLKRPHDSERSIDAAVIGAYDGGKDDDDLLGESMKKKKRQPRKIEGVS